MRRVITIVAVVAGLAGCDAEDDPCLEHIEESTRMVLAGADPTECLVFPLDQHQPCQGLAAALKCVDDETQCNYSSGETAADFYREALTWQLQCLERR